MDEILLEREGFGLEFVATKASALWWSPYQRLIRLSHGNLTTHDPTDSRVTNMWPLQSVIAIERRGESVTMQIMNDAFHCLQAFLEPTTLLSLRLPTSECAAALQLAILKASPAKSKLNREMTENHQSIKEQYLAGYFA